MSEILESIKYSSWPEMVIKLLETEDDSKIYRGHSNEYKRNLKKSDGGLNSNKVTELNIWPLISSFDRYYKDRNYHFSSFLSQQFENNNFIARYGKHKFNEILYLRDCNQLERIYYFQHYGIPTCFMDFSLSSLTALFFAISTVRSADIYSVDKDGDPLIHPPEPYISVYEINHRRISEILNVKYIDSEFSWLTYGNYRINFAHFAFDISPIEKCQRNTINENLKLQKGCFILFDNQGLRYSLVEFINSEFFLKRIEKELLIKEHTLCYNDIFKRFDFDGNKNINLYHYLDINNNSGRGLFNDIQGLKFDLNFF